MKICPKCQTTYSDDTLNFCLNDGAVLSQASDKKATDSSLPETVMMDPPRPTAPDRSYGDESSTDVNQTQPSSFPGQDQAPATWTSPTQARSQPGTAAKPKSRAWLWVLGILFGVVLLCGGGLAVIVAVSSFDEQSSANSGPDDDKKTNNPFDDRDDKTKLPTADDFGEFSNIGLSNCTDIGSRDAVAEYKNGECILKTKKRGYYYVIVMTAGYQTDDSKTRVTVRNTQEKPTRLGFGLVFHSKPTPLEQDYAFLIDTEKRRYRVVRHNKQQEYPVINWKNSKVIKSGTQKNVLEVRAEDEKIDLYINGQYIESLKNQYGYDGGVPGIYTGDGIPVAFSNFQTSD